MPRVLLGLAILCCYAFASAPNRVMFSVKKVNLSEQTVVLEPMQSTTYTATWKGQGDLKDVPAEHQIWHCEPSVVEFEGHRYMKLSCLNEQGEDLGNFLVNKQTFTKEMK